MTTNDSEMKHYWAWTDTNTLVPLGECADFEEASSRAPGTTHWIFDRAELEEFHRELFRELPELLESLTGVLRYAECIGASEDHED